MTWSQVWYCYYKDNSNVIHKLPIILQKGPCSLGAIKFCNFCNFFMTKLSKIHDCTIKKKLQHKIHFGHAFKRSLHSPFNLPWISHNFCHVLQNSMNTPALKSKTQFCDIYVTFQLMGTSLVWNLHKSTLFSTLNAHVYISNPAYTL